MRKNFFRDREAGPARTTKSGGFVKMILIVIAGLVLLKYIYDVDVVGFLTQGRFKEILDKIYNWATAGWERYQDTLIAIWNYAVALIKKI